MQIFAKTFWESFKHCRQASIKEEITEGDNVALFTEDGLCVLLDRVSKRCAVYNNRPKVCRDYGVIKDLPCPYVKPNGNPRSPAQERRTQRSIDKDIKAKMAALDLAVNVKKVR